MSELVLYHGDLSPCAHKVRLALIERDIPFESKLLNLMAKENLRPDYLKLNPKGVVPTLVHGDNVVTESTVICEYLEDSFSDNPLMPESSMGRVVVRHWFKWVDEQLHPNSMPIIFGGLARYIWLAKSEEERKTLLDQVPDPARRARQERLIALGFDAPDVEVAVQVWKQTFDKMEQQLSRNHWLAGNEFTLADCALTPYMFVMKYLQVDSVFDRYPALGDWMNRILDRPAFEASVRPYVAEERWEKIAQVAGKSGPELSVRMFG